MRVPAVVPVVMCMVYVLTLIALPALAAELEVSWEFVGGVEPNSDFDADLETTRQMENNPCRPKPRSVSVPPSSHDISAHMPPMRNQGQQPSCVAWATAYYVKSYQEGVERGWDLADPSHVFSPAYVFNQILHEKKASDAISIPEAFQLLQERGCAPWALFPYDVADTRRLPPAPVQQQAAPYRIYAWHAVDYRDQGDLKRLIASDTPVVVGLNVDKSFFKFRGGGIIRDYDANTARKYHSVCLVGYDDSKKAFKMVNSWGDRWGDQGYAWIDYALIPRICQEAYHTDDAPNLPMADSPEAKQAPGVILKSKVDAEAFEKKERGVRVSANVTLRGLKGEELVAEARFFWDAGNPLADPDGDYTTPEGQVCVGTTLTPGKKEATYKGLTLFLPYEQLHLDKRGDYPLKAQMLVRRAGAGKTEILCMGELCRFRFKRASSAEVQRIWLEHEGSFNGMAGLWVHGELEVRGLIGQKARVTARVCDLEGKPLPDMDGQYSTGDGCVGLTLESPCAFEINYFENFPLFVPYAQLHLEAGRGKRHELKCRIEIEGPSGPLCVSEWVPFSYKSDKGSWE